MRRIPLLRSAAQRSGWTGLKSEGRILGVFDLGVVYLTTDAMSPAWVETSRPADIAALPLAATWRRDNVSR